MLCSLYLFKKATLLTSCITACPPNSPARSRLSSRPQKDTTDEEDRLSFPHDVSHFKNVCELPEAGSMHGLFLSPWGLSHTNTLVPTFTKSKLSSNQDLTMPSPDYSSEMTPIYKPYDESEDMPWDQKENRVYWMGAKTDGYFSDDRWRSSQRYRFIRDLNNGSKPISLLRQNIDSSSWEPYNATMKALSKYVDVKFSDRVQNHCSEAVCKEMEDPKEGLVTSNREPTGAPYGNKFAFDIDGHSYTERFRRLLYSHNTVFKMTIFHEWHDDFLVPWVHYVPVTLGMEELPETLRFFLETEKGQEIGKAIAEDGRRWAQEAWRLVDMKIALFRILLEYGRLWGPGRDITGECPWDRKR